MLKEFLASLHPSLAVLDGVPMWVFAIVVVLTAVVLLGYLLKGGQVGWQLWMSVRRIRALTKKGSGPVKPEDVACDGCQSTGPQLFSHCAVCDVRLCAHGKGYATCAECGEYGECKTINGFFGFCPEAKPALDGLRAK